MAKEMAKIKKCGGPQDEKGDPNKSGSKKNNSREVAKAGEESGDCDTKGLEEPKEVIATKVSCLLGCIM